MKLAAAAKALAERLEKIGRRVVFAESCTAGLVAASLAQVPGVSNQFCGSAVTYREGTKQRWLGVSADDLAEHSDVSEPVARQMAAGVLGETPEAEYSAAITGHLGPNAPDGLDGVVYIAIGARQGCEVEVEQVRRHELKSRERNARQEEAAALLLAELDEYLSRQCIDD